MNYNNFQNLVSRTKHKTLLPLNPLDEVKNYHCVTSTGYAALLVADDNGKKRQHCFPVSELHDQLSKIDPNKDVWLSVSQFWSSRRRVDNLKSILMSFLDIDAHQPEQESWMTGKSPEEIAEGFMLLCDGLNVPRPSLITFTGRGIQPRWYFEKPIPGKALPRWNALQKTLLAKFKDYGADPQARDAARVLRLIGTKNSKTGTYCHVVAMTADKRGTPLHYDFEYLCEFILPKTRDEVSAWRKGEPIQIDRLRKKRVSSFKLKQFSTHTLNVSRAEDIATLIKLRGKIDEGSRMIFLFWMMNFLALSHQVTKDNFYSEAQKVAIEIDPRWHCSLSELCTVFEKMSSELPRDRRMLKDEDSRTALYTPKTQTLIDQLQITEEEQKHLKTLISLKEKNARKSRRKNESNKMTMEEIRLRSQARKQRAQTLRAEGKTLRDIAAEMNISKSQVQRLVSVSHSLSLNNGVACPVGKGAQPPLEQLFLNNEQVKGGSGGKHYPDRADFLTLKPAELEQLTLFAPVTPSSRTKKTRNKTLKEQLRSQSVEKTLNQLGIDYKIDLEYKPRRNSKTKRLKIYVDYSTYRELIVTDNRYYALNRKPQEKLRGGGGAIDLTMYLLNLSFSEAMKKLTRSTKRK